VIGLPTLGETATITLHLTFKTVHVSKQHNQRAAKKARTGSSSAAPSNASHSITIQLRQRRLQPPVWISQSNPNKLKVALYYAERHNLRLNGIRKPASEQTRLAVEHPPRSARILSRPTTRLINISMQRPAMHLHGSRPYVLGMGTLASVIVLPWTHDMIFRDLVRAD